MRKIKFRAWEKQLKSMFAVDNLDFENKIVNKDGIWRRFDEVELMQYTGLKDFNGKKIYESDIVKALRLSETYDYAKSCYRNLNSSDEYIFIDVIEFGSGTFKLKDTRYGDGEYDWYSLEQYVSRQSLEEDISLGLEVIGNIYENPELLENVK